jgi:penicillin G amidase
MPITLSVERIKVANAQDEILNVRETAFGPILRDENAGHALVAVWTAHANQAINLRMLDFNEIRDVPSALDAAAGLGIPAQNLLVVDRDGALGWTIAGQIPKRAYGEDARLPLRAAMIGSDGPWSGWIGRERPRIFNPTNGKLWTANARTLSDAGMQVLGDGGYDLGARAQQIRDDLLSRNKLSEDDMLAIQRDDRALYLQHWYAQLRSLPASEPNAGQINAILADWNGRADATSRSYRLVRRFRLEVNAAVVEGLLAPVRRAHPDFKPPKMPQLEGVVWRLLQEQPAHLLPPIYTSWNDLLQQAAQRSVLAIASNNDSRKKTWGALNQTSIKHPLGKAIPALGWLLNMPAAEQSGDNNMPYVAGTTFGSSERFAVSPGAEESGYFHMPGGQSGHPLSPYYGAGHDDWLRGRATPFLPGPEEHVLTLSPMR